MEIVNITDLLTDTSKYKFRPNSIRYESNIYQIDLIRVKIRHETRTERTHIL